MFIDTHCHLYPEFDFVTKTPEAIVEECLQNGVEEMWLASTEKADILWNLEFCKKYPKSLKTWVGWHPEQYLSYGEKFLVSILEKYTRGQGFDDKLPTCAGKQMVSGGKTNSTYNSELLTVNSSIVGIGEIGLDFAVHPKSTKDAQIKVFESQLEIAKRFNLTVAIHCREAFDETVEVMKKYKNIKYLWHCFNLSKDKTEIIFKTFPNIYIGLNAIFTYKSGEYLKDSLTIVPTDRILIETDAPFLIPRPFKYTFNTPEGVKTVYSSLSTFLEISNERLIENIDRNIKEFA